MIYLLRKPFKGSLAENALAHKCGGLNIDACRVPTEEHIYNHGRSVDSPIYSSLGPMKPQQSEGQKLGRWPANFIVTFDESEENLRYFERFQMSDQSFHARSKAVLDGKAVNVRDLTVTVSVGDFEAAFDAMVLLPPELDATVVGVTEKGALIYSRKLVIEFYAKQSGWVPGDNSEENVQLYESAEEWVAYNTERAADYYQPQELRAHFDD